MRQRTIQWEKKETIQIGWTEGYVELKAQPNGEVTIEVGVNKVHEKNYEIGYVSGTRDVDVKGRMLPDMFRSITPTLVKIGLTMRKRKT